MTDTPEIIAKKADGQDIIDDLTALRVKLDALKDEPRWFAGLPPVFEQTRNVTEHHTRAIREAFGLPVPE